MSARWPYLPLHEVLLSVACEPYSPRFREVVFSETMCRAWAFSEETGSSISSGSSNAYLPDPFLLSSPFLKESRSPVTLGNTLRIMKSLP